MKKEDVGNLKGEALKEAATKYGIKIGKKKKVDELRSELYSKLHELHELEEKERTKIPKFGGNSHDRRKQHRAWQHGRRI